MKKCDSYNYGVEFGKAHTAMFNIINNCGSY